MQAQCHPLLSQVNQLQIKPIPFGMGNTKFRTEPVTWLNLSPIFPLGEIAKCRRVNSKTREINSSSEESEEDGGDGLEEPVEVEEDDDSHGGERKSDSDEDSENDHREEDGKDLNEKPKKKYGKGMKVLELFFWTSVDHFYYHNSKR